MINLFLIIINIITFIIYGIDKLQAIRHKYRISENTLLIFSFLGGSIGALLGMIIFRHKINKPKFYLLIPLFLILHIYLYYNFFI